MFRFLSVTLILGIQLFEYSVSAEVGKIKYLPLFETYGGFEIDMNKGTINYGHIVGKIGFCLNEREFVCVLGGGQDFVVPLAIKLRSGKVLWEYGKYKFSVVGKFNREIFGFSGELFVIDRIPNRDLQVNGTPRKRFIYSIEHGVIAIANILRERNTIRGADRELPDLRDILVIEGSTGIGMQQ